MPWNSSNRKAQLPPNWSRISKSVIARANGRCQLRYESICIGRATECDHIQRGNNHSPQNLQAACSPCHAHKSAMEGRAAQLQRIALRKRPPEPHPGVIDGGA